MNFPEFKYDKLNLYDLNEYSFFGLNNVIARGYNEAAPSQEAMADEVMMVSCKQAGRLRLAAGKAKSIYNFDYDSDSWEESETITPEIRQNFQETAFFFPQLLTDSTGNVVIKFTAPESTTTWKFMALAHTPTMQFGQIEKFVVTSKKFMINTNLPRFVRTGDKVVLQATINNLTPEVQQGETYLELFVPSTNAVISKQQVTFNVKAQENQTVSFEFTAPENIDLLGCRIVASSSEFSDGEQHVLPVVPNATLATQTLPIFMNRQGQQTFKLNAPKGITPYRLTLELTANRYGMPY